MRNWAAISLAWCFLAAAPAGAAKFIDTYTGYVRGGIDNLALFGAAGADLTGKSFVATYKVDDCLGPPCDPDIVNDLSIVAGTSDNGSSSTSHGTPLHIHYTLNIDGQAQSIDSTTYGFVGSTQSIANGWFQRSASVLDSSGFVRNASNAVINEAPGTPVVSYRERIDLPNQFSGGIPFSGFYYSGAGGSTSLSLFSEKFVALPEPGSWAMVIGGFALIGMASRRRKVDASSLSAIA